MLERIAYLTWRRPKLVLSVVAALAALAAGLGHNVEHHLKAAGFTDSASQSERATALLRESLGYDANPGIVLLVRARNGSRLDRASPALRTEVDHLSAALAQTKYVGRVVNPLRDPRGAALIARDRRSLVISADLATQDVENNGGVAANDAKKRIAPITLAAPALQVSIGGFAASFNEVNDQTRHDLSNAELIAFPALTILLLLVFRGVIAAAIPLLIGGISIVGTLLVLRVMASVVDTSVFALNIATGLSLGLAVDYALLLVSRYREELERDGPTQQAHHRTVTTAGRTVLFSGFTVAVALAALVVLPQRFLYSLAIAGAAVGALSAVTALLVVPSLLSLLGSRINALSIRRGHAVSDDSGPWYRTARGVMRRPVAVALASSALLLAASAPLLSTLLTGPSAEAVPPGQPSYLANAYVNVHYPRAITEAITVTVHGGSSDKSLARLNREIGSIHGIASGTPFARANADVAFANFGAAKQALSPSTQDTVRSIRALAPPPGTTILVSGNTARFIDQKQSLLDHAPLVIALIAGATLLLLFMLTGSVVLPIKTLLMNSMTLAATLGLLVLSFQKGLLTTPLDYTGPRAVEVTSLVFLFAVIFGLATDYAVLVIARIKEQHDLGASNEESVAIGIARTGRVITAAAVCIAVVFLAFAVSSVFFMKEIAIGQAAGVVIDATIVRALLVPSLMRLLGRWNWWAPAPLHRFQQRFGFRETSAPALR